MIKNLIRNYRVKKALKELRKTEGIPIPKWEVPEELRGIVPKSIESQYTMDAYLSRYNEQKDSYEKEALAYLYDGYTELTNECFPVLRVGAADYVKNNAFELIKRFLNNFESHGFKPELCDYYNRMDVCYGWDDLSERLKRLEGVTGTPIEEIIEKEESGYQTESELKEIKSMKEQCELYKAIKMFLKKRSKPESILKAKRNLLKKVNDLKTVVNQRAYLSFKTVALLVSTQLK